MASTKTLATTQAQVPIKIRVMEVDKAMAELLLSYEKQPEVGVAGTNRRAAPDTVKEYARRMVKGIWRLTHQGLAFKGFLDDDTAELADGGQRLRAVIEADKIRPGISVMFMVTEGMTSEAVLAMDVGRLRTKAAFLTMGGHTNTRLLAAMARLAWLYEQPDPELITREGHRNVQFSPEEMDNYIKDNPALKDAVLEGVRLGKILRPTAAGAGWFLAIKSGRDFEAVNEFTDKLFSGYSLPEGSPIHVLRELMRNSERIRRIYSLPEHLAFFIKAYLKWEGEIYTKQLMWRTDEVFPRF